MRSYVDILNELTDTVESDAIPKEDKFEIQKQLQVLFNLLWKYSD